MPLDYCYVPSVLDWDDPPALKEEYDDYLWKLHRELGRNVVFSTLLPLNKVAPLPRATQSVEERFFELAKNWEQETMHLSSTKDLTSHPSYKNIIGLGWDVIPYLLRDLQRSQRFWFPALYEITKVRPFDVGDAGDGKRMTNAWVSWGKRKGII